MKRVQTGMGEFPVYMSFAFVVVHQGAVVFHLVVNSTHPAGREVNDPVWVTGLACVPSDPS